MTSPAEGRSRRALVVGTGLIGGSVGLALRARGWHVTGRDADPGRAAEARQLGALDAVGDDPEAELAVRGHPAGLGGRGGPRAAGRRRAGPAWW